ncbi:major facilitator superfamily domain-containing protein [Hypoxylon sp. FL1284]|nr:major facilitator superfamily domain-containing protein [Hypoxylon sp. FL1284]
MLDWTWLVSVPIVAVITNTRSMLAAAMAKDNESAVESTGRPSRVEEGRRSHTQESKNGPECSGGSTTRDEDNGLLKPPDVAEDGSHIGVVEKEGRKSDGKRRKRSQEQRTEAGPSKSTSKQEGDQADLQRSGHGTDSSGHTSRPDNENAAAVPDTPPDRAPQRSRVGASLDLVRFSLALDRDQMRSVYTTGKLVLDRDQLRKVRSTGGVRVVKEEKDPSAPKTDEENAPTPEETPSPPEEAEGGGGADDGVKQEPENGTAGNGVMAAVLPLSDLGKSIVGWESQDDPKMPLNFSAARKWVVVWALAAITFMSPFSSSVLAPAIKYINRDFHNHNAIEGTFPVSIYLLGYATGPLFLAPLSEILGRAGVLALANIVFCTWHVGCALAPALKFLIAFRFCAGVGGSGCMTLGGAIIGDLFPIEKRGVALSIWALGPLIGPTLGPLVGAFIAESIGWRWAFWIVLIPSIVITVVLATFLPETNHHVLMQRKTQRLRRELKRPELRSCYEAALPKKVSQLAILRHGMLRPLKMLVFAPMVLIQSLYVSFIYGSVYLMYNAIPPTFEHRYHWSTGASGLVFISIGLGYMVGLWAFSMLSDRTVVRLTRANNGVFKPEFRLTVMIWYSFLCPLAFFWYGWTAETRAHWVVPVIGLFPLGFGVIGVFMPTQAYIIDAYPAYAASGIAAFTVLRSVVAAFLPLCGPALFGTLGIGWGNSLLGFVGVAMIPIPIFIYRYGATIRERFPLKL